jgi:tetratricopeptide (TPR) repeat protein
MSEVPSTSWDSRSPENGPAGPAGSAGTRGAGEFSDSGGPAELGDSVNGNSFTGNSVTGNSGDDADVHGWYTRGLELLGRGSPAAAAQILQRAARAVPESRSVREALARAQFDTGQYAAAAENFRAIIEASPTEDYAYFGLGLSLSRTGEHAAAAQYLALAAAMRPLKHYTEALRQVRATLEARKRAADGDS